MRSRYFTQRCQISSAGYTMIHPPFCCLIRTRCLFSFLRNIITYDYMLNTCSYIINIYIIIYYIHIYIYIWNKQNHIRSDRHLHLRHLALSVKQPTFTSGECSCNKKRRPGPVKGPSDGCCWKLPWRFWPDYGTHSRLCNWNGLYTNH